MIIVENIVINGKEFKKAFSDNNKIIKKVGSDEEYVEAVDVLDSDFVYEETEKEIDTEEKEKGNNN